MHKCGDLRLNRRTVLSGLAASGASLMIDRRTRAEALLSSIADRPTEAAEVFLDLNRIRKWDESMGDTWDPFWADDDSLYAFNCDGRGFGRTSMNLAFNRLTGTKPESLVGSQVNEMAEYGRSNQKEADDATWKACGQECIDGVFYAFVSRNVYGSDSHDPLTRQLALNSSLIKSTDRGRSWVRSARENYDRPMWPGPKFGAPFFVHYGRNGGQVSKDNATEYVYACSTNGFWNDGDSLILGRVRRKLLPNMAAADWEYLTGSDGNATSQWSDDIDKAVPILARPAKWGQTPITYVPQLGTYLLISWYNTEPMTKWFEPNEMRYDFYQAPHPWGPWKLVGSASDSFLGPDYHMYGPSICARFQQQRGADVELTMFTAGCPFDDVPATPYKMWTIPLLLRAAPLPASVPVKAADSTVQYKGPWFPWTTSQTTRTEDLPRATLTRDSSAELVFTGTGIDYVATKSSAQGSVVIFVDDAPQGQRSLRLEDFPVLLGVTVFSMQGLARGEHKIRVVNADGTPINLEGFRVYS